MSASPLAGLSILASEGASVTNDGSVTENGQTMTQYTVVGRRLASPAPHYIERRQIAIMDDCRGVEVLFGHGR